MANYHVIISRDLSLVRVDEIQSLIGQKLMSFVTVEVWSIWACTKSDIGDYFT